MLYNVTAMATLWHSLAAKNVRLLRYQCDRLAGFGQSGVFLNYLRCHDDIGWGLDYAFLRGEGVEERAHKHFLNEYFTGRFGDSPARGELYNVDEFRGDARLCGTTASLCGLESACERKDPVAIEQAIRCIGMMHACMLTLRGIPLLYSGDELGQLNDYGYHDDPASAHDSRHLHRGAFPEEAAATRSDPHSIAGRLFGMLCQLERLRRQEPVFRNDAACYPWETHTDAVLCLAREFGDQRMLGLFNFSPWPQDVWLNQTQRYTDLLSGEQMPLRYLSLDAYEFRWLRRENTAELKEDRL